MQVPSAASTDAVSENVSVAVRIRPLNVREVEQRQQAVWRPLPGVEGHVQLYNEKEEPVPKQTFAYGESAHGTATMGVGWVRRLSCARAPAAPSPPRHPASPAPPSTCRPRV